MTETEEAIQNVLELIIILLIVRFIWLIFATVVFKRQLSKDDIGFLIAVIIIPVIIYSLIKVLFKRRDKDETL